MVPYEEAIEILPIVKQFDDLFHEILGLCASPQEKSAVLSQLVANLSSDDTNFALDRLLKLGNRTVPFKLTPRVVELCELFSALSRAMNKEHSDMFGGRETRPETGPQKLGDLFPLPTIDP